MANVPNRLTKLTSALDDISAAGDAARLQLHLLALQTRESTDKLEASVHAIEEKLGHGLEQVLQATGKKTRDLADTVRTYLGTHAAIDEKATVRTIMTVSVASCRPTDTLNAAAQIMWDQDCGAVPVVDAEGRLCGIITDRDVCMAAYTQGALITAISVGDVMSGPAHTCHPDDTLTKAATLMADAQVRRLPVVDAQDHPIGIVSMADIVRNVRILGEREAESLTFQLLRAVSRQRDARD
jgi:CBS domain-containing protein